MMLSITGNIGVGKTTYIKEIKKLVKYKNFKVITLDDFRRKWNKENTIKGEERAQKELIKALSQHRNIILESSGTGKWFPEYLQSYRKAFNIETIHSLLLRDTVKNCKARHLQRERDGYKLPPFPYNIPIDTGLTWIHEQLTKQKVENEIRVTKSIELTFSKIKSKI